MGELIKLISKEVAEEGFGWKAVVTTGVVAVLLLSVGIGALSYMIEVGFN